VSGLVATTAAILVVGAGLLAPAAAASAAASGAGPAPATATGPHDADPSDGYWLVASDGGVFTFGDAGYFGSTGSIRLNRPIVGMAATPDGGGYWLVASDGGVFTFGDAGYFGSTGALHLNAPIVGMAATPDGGGYWLVASDGGIFTFGDAVYFGSAPGVGDVAGGVVSMGSAPGGGGYWLVGADGRIDSFGSASAEGSMAGRHLQAPVVGFAVAPPSGASGSQAPLGISTAPLPTATLGTFYSVNLTATGGVSPYSWRLTSGSLPGGLSLSPSGAVTGAPTAVGTFAFSVVATDSAVPIPSAASAALSLTVAPAPVTETMTTSANWSGYEELNGPYTQITGTFTVPSLFDNTPPDEQMAIWVGIDGANDDGALIQAGINEVPVQGDPSEFLIEPWWEILPSSETFIRSVAIAPGDQVTIGIAQTPGTDDWQIELTDDTNGQSFTTDQSYGGPADTAEWIVEALTEGDTVNPLSPFSPAVDFSQLKFLGSNTMLQKVVMVQGGQQVATPSPLSTNGFAVAYGNVAPPAP
jgi:hypothetical protein